MVSRGDGSARTLLVATLLGIAALSLVQVVRLVTGLAPPLDGTFDGPDSYLRIVRVLECRGGFACEDGVLARSNAPFGEVVLWPFLEDRLLMAGALLLSLFLPFRAAVIATSYLWGPLLSIAFVALLVRVARFALPVQAIAFAALLLASQLWVVLAFAPHAVDHHGLVLLLFTAALAAAAPALTGKPDRRSAMLLGVALGVGLWESVEALIGAIPLFAVLGVLWVARGGELARYHRDAFGAATLVLLIALGVDGPHPAAFAAEYDRFSIVHVVLLGAATAFWAGVGFVRGEDTSVMRRVVVAAAGALIVPGVTTLIFPDFARGPLADVAPGLMEAWQASTTEFMPAMAHGSVWRIIALGPLLAALPISLYLALRGPVERRPLWAYMAAAFAFFGALTAFAQIRFTFTLHALVPIPFAWLVWRIGTSMRRRLPGLAVAGVNVVFLLVMFAMPVMTATIFAPEPVQQSARPCTGVEISDALNALPGSAHDVVLADLYYGPEILFRTAFDVITIPQFRSGHTTLDSRAIMRATSDAEARRLLAARRVRWIAICPGIRWQPIVEPDDPGTFYAALQRDEPPAWLRRAAGADPANPVRVFEVMQSRPADVDRSARTR